MNNDEEVVLLLDNLKKNKTQENTIFFINKLLLNYSYEISVGSNCFTILNGTGPNNSTQAFYFEFCNPNLDLLLEDPVDDEVVLVEHGIGNEYSRDIEYRRLEYGTFRIRTQNLLDASLMPFVKIMEQMEILVELGDLSSEALKLRDNIKNNGGIMMYKRKLETLTEVELSLLEKTNEIKSTITNPERFADNDFTVEYKEIEWLREAIEFAATQKCTCEHQHTEEHCRIQNLNLIVSDERMILAARCTNCSEFRFLRDERLKNEAVFISSNPLPML